MKISGKYTGTLALCKFALRRDRVWLALWTIGIVSLVVACGPLFPEIAKTPAELASFSETMKNPAMIAMTGPVYAEPYTYGILYAQMMTAWILIVLGVMNFFLVSRHLRKDEEEGLIEVMRSLPIGRSSIVLGTAIETLLANLAIALLSTVGLVLTGVESIDLAGSLVLGGIIFCGGLIFTAIAMLFSQIFMTSRGATGFSFAVLGVLYALGAMGNIEGGAMANISLFSFVFKTSPFSGNYIWPFFILLGEAVVIGFIAVLLNARRDLGAGFIPQRNGRAHAKASLSSPLGFALRQTRTSNIAWILIMLVVGIMYGSIFGDFENFVESSDFFKAMIMADVDAGANAMLSFMTYITLIMSVIAAIPVINVVYRIRGEEKRNRIEQIYSKAVAKRSFLLSYVGIALVLSVLLQAAEGLGLWMSTKVVMSEPFALSEVLAAGFIKLPAIWLIAGLGVLLLGLLPRLTSLVWLYLGTSFFLLYLGRVMDIPKAFMDGTAFGALPDCPIENFAPLPVALVTVMAAALLAAGTIFYSKREISYR
ncbi:MAG: ABC transporter permease subunit [Clostridiales Family XIII bacterium]|nr:ABC transporter permease subunit [Clostridiales Family XIII bacterium]